MKFRVTVEKLKLGWNVLFNVASKKEGQKLAAKIGTISVGQNLVEKKYATTLKSVGGKAYKVSLYRSKLQKQVLPLIAELFKELRDEQKHK